jgi:SAM-dependent methyltransferase
LTQQADPPRPRRADVADSYDRGAAAYETLWSPVILPPAIALVTSLPLTSRCVIADVGAGTGALLDVIGAASPTARVAGLDASPEMLRVARARRGAPAIVADALALRYKAWADSAGSPAVVPSRNAGGSLMRTTSSAVAPGAALAEAAASSRLEMACKLTLRWNKSARPRLSFTWALKIVLDAGEQGTTVQSIGVVRAQHPGTDIQYCADFLLRLV